MDGDGRVDVLQSAKSVGTSWYRNRLGATPAFEARPISATRGQIRVADLSGDGKNDVLIGYSWCQNQGTTFTTRLLAPDFKPVDYNYYGEVAVGDLDRDGDLDPVTYNPAGGSSTPLRVFWNDGRPSPGFTGSQLGTYHSAPVLGDMDGDGNLDILTYSLVQYHNQSPLQPVTVLTPTEAGRAYTSGNKLDIYWRTDTKKAGTAVTLELWRNNKKVAALGSSYSTTGRGHAQVTLPLVASGGGYRIKAVSSYAPTLYYDFSDEPFVIKGKGNAVPSAAWAGYH